MFRAMAAEAVPERVVVKNGSNGDHLDRDRVAWVLSYGYTICAVVRIVMAAHPGAASIAFTIRLSSACCIWLDVGQQSWIAATGSMRATR
jgi:hypothetical protein